MPIRPENKHRYPPDWKNISNRIKFHRARGRCECRGECGRGTHVHWWRRRCPNRHGMPAYGTGSKVVLTTAHLNHEPEDCRDSNLKAMCQGCHLHYDREHHAETRRANTAPARLSRMEPIAWTAVFEWDDMPTHGAGPVVTVWEDEDGLPTVLVDPIDQNKAPVSGTWDLRSRDVGRKLVTYWRR